MAACQPFWKWHRWKSIVSCLWPTSTCMRKLKFNFQSKLDLCSGNHVVYRQTDGRTDNVNTVYPPPPPSNFVGRGGGIKTCWENGQTPPNPQLLCKFKPNIVKDQTNTEGAHSIWNKKVDDGQTDDGRIGSWYVSCRTKIWCMGNTSF